MDNANNFEFPLHSFASAVRSALLGDSLLQGLITNVYFRIAADNAKDEFVLQQLKAGTFLNTIGGTYGVTVRWDLEAVAGARDGKAPLERCEEIANRMYSLLNHNEATLQPHLAPLGMYCEFSQAISLIPPSLQNIAGAQRWRYGHNYEFQVQGLED